MNKKIAIQFTVLTFCLAFALNAVEYVIAQIFGETFILEEAGGFTFGSYAVFGIVAAILATLTPAVASYVVLKKNGEVTGLKEWLKNVFYFKTSVSHYVFVAVWLVLYFVIHITISGLTEMMPLYMLLGMIPLALLAGGMEEAGWSYILHPALNKKFGYFTSSVMMGVISWAWHIPLFFIPGTSHYQVINIWMFLVSNIGLRLFYGAILKKSGRAGIFLTVLHHTMLNAFMMTFIFLPTNWTATIVALVVVLLVSSTSVLIHNKDVKAV